MLAETTELSVKTEGKVEVISDDISRVLVSGLDLNMDFAKFNATFDKTDTRLFFRQLKRHSELYKAKPEQIYQLCNYRLGQNASSEWLANSIEDKLPITGSGTSTVVPSILQLENHVLSLLEPENLKGFLLRDFYESRLDVKHQTPREFSVLLKNKLLKAIPEAKQDTVEQLCIIQLITGTPQHWHQKLFETGCSTVESLLDKCNLILLAETPSRSSDVRRTFKKGGEYSGSEKFNLNKGKQYKCYGCGSTSHLIKFCKAFCDNCKVKGHDRKFCKNKKDSSNSSSQSSGSNSKKNSDLLSPDSVKRIRSNSIELEFLIGNQIVKGVVDTGSRYTLMSEKLSDHLKIQVRPTTKDFKSANNSALVVCGVAQVPLQECKSENPKSVDVYIIRGLSDPFIVGLETLQLFQFQIDCSAQSIVRRVSLEEILVSNPNVFALTNSDYGQLAEEEGHVIKTSGPPVKLKPYKIPLHYQSEVKRQIDEMLDKQIIEPSKSAYAAPVVLVPKKGGGLRFCVNYSKLNSQTLDDAYPIPNMEKLLLKLREGVWFTKLDMKAGYWHVPVHPDSRDKTAFISSFGLFNFLRLPFGLRTAPASFMRIVDKIIKPFQSFCVAYLDDIVVYTNTDNYDKHLVDLGKVLTALSEAGVKLNKEKCELAVKSISFLGHKVSQNALDPLESKTEEISNWPVPKSVKEVRIFLGLAGFYRQFVPRFSIISAPLSDLLKKDQEFLWQQKHEQAFVKLKELLINPPVLRSINENKQFQLICDASGLGCGVVLEQDGQPVAFASKRWSNAESKRDTTRRELEAVMFGIKKFDYFLRGKHFVVVTDHQALKHLLSRKDVDDMLFRRIQKLAGYSFEIQYKPGREIPHADALSRKPVVVRKIVVQEYNFRESVETDPVLCIVKHSLDNKIPIPSDSPELSFWSRRQSSLRVEDGMILRCGEKSPQRVVPVDLRPKVLDFCHGHQSSGHFGLRRTLHKLTQSFYWYNMKNDVRTWCRSCILCAKNKVNRRRSKEGCGTVPVEGKSRRQWAADIVGPLNVTNGFKYILVVTDYLSKWVELFPLRTQTAEEVGDNLSRVFARYPTSSSLLTDQGANFESALVKNLCKRMGVEKLRTTSYHPQTDGQTERFNNTLCEVLRSLLQGKPEWENMLPWAASAYNTSVHAITGLTPHELIFGEIPHGFLGSLDNNPQDTSTAEAFALSLRERLRELSVVAHNNINRKVKKRIIDPEVSFKSGDYVMYKNLGKKTKLGDPLFNGPYLVLEANQPNYTLNLPRGRVKVHGIHLKPFKELSFPDLVYDSDSDSEAELQQEPIVQQEPVVQPELSPIVPDIPESASVFKFLPERSRSGREIRKNPKYL